jgi:hypothetical protein
MAPYKSGAQQRYFHYLESKGKMPKKTVDEFDHSTDYEHLPEKMNFGGKAHLEYGDEDAPHNFEEMPNMDRGGRMKVMRHNEMAPHMNRGGSMHVPEEMEEAPRLSRGGRAMKGYAAGGMVDDEAYTPDNYDYQMGHASEYDSAGEPHTEDDLEDEHPMEYMAAGGVVPPAHGMHVRGGKKMSKGGMARGFAKALMKHR